MPVTIAGRAYDHRIYRGRVHRKGFRSLERDWPEHRPWPRFGWMSQPTPLAPATLSFCRSGSVRDWRRLASAVCSSGERERASSYRFEHLARRFLCGRAMLRQVVADHDGVDPAAVKLRSRPGKPPGIDGSSLDVSVSYSGDVAAVLVGSGPLGLDIEQISRERDVEAIARRAFTEDELWKLRELRRLGACVARDYFYDVWVRKEAVSKAMGMGLGIDFEHLIPATAARSIGCRLRTFWLDDDCLAAVTLPEASPGLRLVAWDGTGKSRRCRSSGPSVPVRPEHDAPDAEHV